MMINHVWQQAKNVYHFWQAEAWRARYGWPDRTLRLYAVTGTNGKTTTCHVLASILREARGRSSVGMLTTIAYWIGEREEVNESKMTTLDSRVFFAYLQKMRQAGVTDVVFEITSHALDQHRLGSIRLQGGIILNLAREHLDYHQTMLAYARAKARLGHYLRRSAPLVVKADDTWVQRIADWIRVARLDVRIIPFTAAAAETVVTPLVGAVMRENVIAAQLLAHAVGIEAAAVARGVAACAAVPGRMEWVVVQGKPRVLIDYAVTPDALERLYAEVRHATRGRLVGVLGAAGRRDRGKRSLMATAVARYADLLVLTREDPWDEPEEQIFADLEQGLTEHTIPWRRIIDRRQALAWALAEAGAEGAVIVTGKGAETGMAIGSQIVPWHERTVVTELLAQYRV